MSISGFTFCHNALEGGYPIVEAINAVRNIVTEIVAVDMESTDGTRDVLKKLGCRIIEGQWYPVGGGDHACLDVNWAFYTECKESHVLHFEADEVFSPSLIYQIYRIHNNYKFRNCDLNIHVPRIQVEQNFQRIRWYPTWVHRLWNTKDTSIIRHGHTTDVKTGEFISVDYGYLWDVTYNFRDNLVDRLRNNSILHGGDPNYTFVPYHCTLPVRLSLQGFEEIIKEPHWEWKTSPFNLPESLKLLVGKTRYEVNL